MLVKIGDKIYDPNDQPIMIVLSERDKFNIAHMADDATKYCVFPDTMLVEDIEEFIKLPD